MKRIIVAVLIFLVSVSLMGCGQTPTVETGKIPSYSGEKIVEMNGNQPNFTKKQMTAKKTYAKYSRLDRYGRAGKVTAELSSQTLATETRGSIGMYKPSGWQTIRYSFVDGKYLYNRSHLLGFQLYGNDTNREENLITGTRQFNAESMLSYENEVASYIKRTGNHVVYRVTPKYKGTEPVARGVQMEAYSVEDKGKLKFNVFVFNVQDGVKIDYKTGDSKATNGEQGMSVKNGYENDSKGENRQSKETYVLNKNTGKFHRKDCRYAKGNNTEVVHESKGELEKQGFSACKVCEP